MIDESAQFQPGGFHESDFIQIGIVVSAVTALLAGARAWAQGGQGVKEIPYDSVPNFPEAAQANAYMGEGIGVAARLAGGHVFTYTRSGAARLCTDSMRRATTFSEISPTATTASRWRTLSASIDLQRTTSGSWTKGT